MAIQNQGTVRPTSDEPFRFSPIFREDYIEDVPVSQTKGVDIMLGMLLEQYQNKPNLVAYFRAFFEEMDSLFYQLDSVYLGRTIQHAVGVQLDIIGVIIDQSRQIALADLFFGFAGAGEKMAAEATPGDGGIFKGEESAGFVTTPLTDAVYRRLLLAKAQVHNRDSISINQLYYAVSTLLGRTTKLMELVTTTPRQLELRISQDDTTANDEQMIQYLARYIIPLGTTLTVTRVP